MILQAKKNYDHIKLKKKKRETIIYFGIMNYLINSPEL